MSFPAGKACIHGRRYLLPTPFWDEKMMANVRKVSHDSLAGAMVWDEDSVYRLDMS